MSEQDERDILYSYWNTLPIKGVIEVHELENLSKNPIRKFIMEYLREGLEDDLLRIERLGRRRHAFSAKELHEAFISKLNSKQKKPTVQNIHFHIKNLLNKGFIQEITEITIGNIKTKYYGRVCVMYFFDDFESAKEIEKNTLINPVISFLKGKDSEFDEAKLENLFEQSYKRKAIMMNEIMYKWMEKNMETIYKNKINVYNLSLFLQFAIQSKLVFPELYDYGLNKLNVDLDIDFNKN